MGFPHGFGRYSGVQHHPSDRFVWHTLCPYLEASLLSARVVSWLDAARTLHAVQEIDAALQRLLKGQYGVCEACGGRVAVARLRAVAATRYCTDCAAQYEKKQRPRQQRSRSRSFELGG